MQNLIDVYKNVDSLVDKLNKSKEKIKGIATPFETVVLGAPFILKDELALGLYETILLAGTHFVPGKKPFVGMNIGGFIEADKVKEKDQMYLSLDGNCMFVNAAFLHMARMYEKKLTDWAKLDKKVQKTSLKLYDLLSKKKKIFAKEFLKSSYFAACGLDYISAPAPEFVEKLKDLVEDLQRDTVANEEVISLAGSIIEQCTPFTTIGKEMLALRHILGNKGHLVNHESYFGMSSPAHSVGAAWLQSVSDDIIDAVPNPNCKKSSVVSLMPVTTAEKNITFLINPTTLAKLQKVVDKNADLKNMWPKYMYKPGASKKEVIIQADSWLRLVHTYFAAEEETKSIIKDAVDNHILGLQLDLSDKEGKGILRPVVTETYFNANSSDLTAIEAEGKAVKAEYVGFALDIDDGLYGRKSIFDSEDKAA